MKDLHIKVDVSKQVLLEDGPSKWKEEISVLISHFHREKGDYLSFMAFYVYLWKNFSSMDHIKDFDLI